DVAAGTGNRERMRRPPRGERMGVGRILDAKHAGDARQLDRLRGDRRRIHRAHQDGDLCAGDARGAGDGLGGAGVELRALVLGDDEDTAAHSKPLLLSAASSSAASVTLMPFCRCGGGSKRTSFSCWRCSTPRALRVRVSSGFFFAFMMSGSLT